MVGPRGLSVAYVLPPTDVEMMTMGPGACLAWSLLAANVIAGDLVVTGVEGAPKVVFNLDVEVLGLGIWVVVSGIRGSSSWYARLCNSLM